MSVQPERTEKETSLADVQGHMVEAVQRPQPLEAYPELRERTLRHIAGNDRLSPVEQLDIYRQQFWLRHIDVLRDDFPTLVYLLGDEGFDALCRAYLGAHPPDSFSLRDLGSRLAEFLARTEPWKSDPLLADATRLEWAFVEAFDARDVAPLDPGSIATARPEAWPSARIAFHPSVQRVALAYPSHELRAAVRDKKSPPKPEPSARWVVVYRGGDHKLRYIDIEREAFELTELLARGCTLESACDALAEALGLRDAEALQTKVGTWFRDWASFGWVVRVDFAAGSP